MKFFLFLLFIVSWVVGALCLPDLIPSECIVETYGCSVLPGYCVWVNGGVAAYIVGGVVFMCVVLVRFFGDDEVDKNNQKI